MTQKWYLKAVQPFDCPSTEMSAVQPVAASNWKFSDYARAHALWKDKQGASQSSTIATTGATTAAQNGMLGFWTSLPLQAGTYGSGTWTMALMMTESNINANAFAVEGIVYFYRPSTGAVVGAPTYVKDSDTAVGVEFGNNTTNNYGQVLTWTGANVTIQNDDILVFELWVKQTQAMGVAYTLTCFYDGSTDVTSASTTTSAAAYLQAPADIPERIAAITPNTADASVFTTTTPALEFIGNCPQPLTELVDYEIQIGTTNPPQQTMGLNDWPYAVTNGTVTLNTTTDGYGQSFTGNGQTIKQLALLLFQTGSATGNAVAKIYAHTGTFGSTGTPTGAALATSDNFDVSTLSGSTLLPAVFTFSGGNQITLTNGTNYFVTIEWTASGSMQVIVAGNDAQWGAANMPPGNRARHPTGGAWGSDGASHWLMFAVNYTAPTIFASSKRSADAAAFFNLDSGGDTAPGFTNNNNIRYTVQTPLSVGTTYYWRVRVFNSGSRWLRGPNFWSSWSTVRSFTIATPSLLSTPLPSPSTKALLVR